MSREIVKKRREILANPFSLSSSSMLLVTFTKPAKKRRELETKMMKEKLFVFLKQSRCQVCVSKIPEIKDQKTKPFFTPLESSGPSHSLQFMYQLHTWLVVLFNNIVDLKFSPIFWTKCMRFQDMKFYIVCYCLSQPSMVQWLRSPIFPCLFVPPYTNPLPLLLTQFHHISTSTSPY